MSKFGDLVDGNAPLGRSGHRPKAGMLIRGSLVRAQEEEQSKMIKPLYFYSVAVFL